MKNLTVKHCVDISNINASNQLIISGSKTGIDAMVKELQMNEKDSRFRGRYLPTKGAFHSHLMKDSAQIINDRWDAIELNNKLSCDLYLNILGGKYDVEMGTIADIMKPQLYSTMNWHQCMVEYMKTADSESQDIDYHFIEIGSKKTVLNKFVSDNYKNTNINVMTINSSKTIDQIQSILK